MQNTNWFNCYSISNQYILQYKGACSVKVGIVIPLQINISYNRICTQQREEVIVIPL